MIGILIGLSLACLVTMFIAYRAAIIAIDARDQAASAYDKIESLEKRLFVAKKTTRKSTNKKTK